MNVALQKRGTSLITNTSQIDCLLINQVIVIVWGFESIELRLIESSRSNL